MKILDYIKITKNRTVFCLTLVYSVLIGLIYSFDNFNLVYLTVNTCIFILTLGLSIVNGTLFLIIVDAFIRQEIQFKERFFQIIKSIFISKLILFPVSICLLVLNMFIKMDLVALSKCITFLLIYASQFILLFTYKKITQSSWDITIKVVTLQFIFSSFLSLLLKFI